jgi:hypothetical protein
VENLPPVAPDLPADCPPDAGKKVRWLSLSDIDGRTAAARAVRALIADIEADLGGVDRMSAGERAIAARAALGTAMLQHMESVWLSGRPIDIAQYSTLTNSVARSFKMLGLERRAKDVVPSLAQYLDARAPAAPPPLPMPPAAPPAAASPPTP